MRHLQIRESLLDLSFLENQESRAQLPPISKISGSLAPSPPPASSTLRTQETGDPQPPSSPSSPKSLLSQDSEGWVSAPSVLPASGVQVTYSPQDPGISDPKAHLGFPVTAHVSTSVSPSLTTAWEAWIRAVGESVGRSEMGKWLSGLCRTRNSSGDRWQAHWNPLSPPGAGLPGTYTARPARTASACCVRRVAPGSALRR